MWDFFKIVATSPAGSFVWLLAIMAIIMGGSWLVGKWTEKLKVVDKLDDSIGVIKTDLFEIKGMMRLFERGNNPLGQAQSPINLSKLGKDISDDIGAEAMVESQWDKIMPVLKEKLKPDCNSYDIQEVCFNVGRGYGALLSSNQMESVKSQAFNRGINLSDFDLLFGIVIRNKYFAKIGKNLSDIDNHTPPPTQVKPKD
jgi:hypothetical protein